MRIVLTIIILLIAPPLFSQNSFVYKRNAFGVLEVYQSQYGLPTGNPLYQIKKNVFGYLEIENLNTSPNPYTRRPDYSTYVTQGYNLPTKQILETIETLNKKQEYDYINSNAFQARNSQNSDIDRITKDFQSFFEDRNRMASSLLNFYNSNISFQSSFKNGWYDVVEIYNQDGLARLNVKEGVDYKYGVCKVVDNRIVEYYQNSSNWDIKDGYVFQKIKFDLASPIRNNKSSYRTLAGRYNFIYFLDNLLDSSKQIPNPQFSYYSLYTTTNFKESTVLIQIARNEMITDEDIKSMSIGAYSLAVGKESLSQGSGDCSNGLLTIAFRKPESNSDHFHMAIYRISDFKKWILRSISYKEGECHSSILNE